jgi:hypothetical protein
MASKGYSGAWGKLINEKKPEIGNLCEFSKRPQLVTQGLGPPEETDS